MSETNAVDPRRLADEGWTRQNVAAEPRLSEVVETYKAMGHEVLLVPMLRDRACEGEAGSCTACFGADENPERFKVIYTRPKRDRADDLEDLFP